MPTVLITGASTGIGRATALRLRARGWTVLAGVRSGEAAERLLADATGGDGLPGPGTLTPLTLDVTDAGQIAAAARALAERGSAGTGVPAVGRLDGLVNNAGIGLGGPLELVSAEEWRTQFDVNVFGAIEVTRALLPALRAARGRIVFLSSVGGRVAIPMNGPYGASKHAIEAIGDSLRGELHRSGIAVSLVEPGSVKTPIWEKARASVAGMQMPPELSEHYGHLTESAPKLLADAERRALAPEHVAAVIERALTARRPRARYLIGRDARGMVLARTLLPARTFDSILRRAVGA